jgi:hypothetical protein
MAETLILAFIHTHSSQSQPAASAAAIVISGADPANHSMSPWWLRRPRRRIQVRIKFLD